jgi:hypothetical protein
MVVPGDGQEVGCRGIHAWKIQNGNYLMELMVAGAESNHRHGDFPGQQNQ